MKSFKSDNAAFERWLRAQCDVVEPDLVYKHERMMESPFIFLRATFFRWSRIIEDHCPECADAPATLAVGDIHVENYGVWRDNEARLVWGINDFDEAAVMPYTLDLLRLATSAVLAPNPMPLKQIAQCVFKGYRRGLLEPRPILLDRDTLWMRPLVMCTDKKRNRFWRDILKAEDVDPPAGARRALERALPKRAVVRRYVTQRKGGGSLGKPRFVAIAQWRNGVILREAKALTMSSWDWAHGRKHSEPKLLDLAYGKSRAPDPWIGVSEGYSTRRLAPDNRKVEFDEEKDFALQADVLALMAQELGAVHSENADAVAAIIADLKVRKKLAR